MPRHDICISIGRRRICLLSDWRQAWRWASMRLIAVALGLQSAYLSLDDRQKESLGKWIPRLTVVCLLAAGVGRIVKQYPETCTDCPLKKGAKNE